MNILLFQGPEILLMNETHKSYFIVLQPLIMTFKVHVHCTKVMLSLCLLFHNFPMLTVC